MHSRTVRDFLIFAVAFVGAISPAFGATVTKISDEALAPLRAPRAGKRITLDKLPLYDSKRSVVELEEFQVWAPDGKVAIYSDKGVRYEAPPAMRFYRGTLNNDPESFVYFSVEGKSGRIEGLIETRDRRFGISAQRRNPNPRPGAPVMMPAEGAEQFDYFVSEAVESDSLPAASAKPWQCAVDDVGDALPKAPLVATGTNGLPVKVEGISGTQKAGITLEIQTDFEYYQNAGSDATTATNYATNLVAALATIYNRDLKTVVTLGMVNLWDTASDPWTTTNPNVGIDELADYYNDAIAGFPHADRTASAVAMLSGKDVASGIASIGQICGPDGFDGTHYFGPYSWNAGIGRIFGLSGFGSIPNPDTTVNGALYGMPVGIANYWPLTQLSHELGHNMGSRHTHCMALDAGEIESAGRSFVDTCYNGDGGGCFSGVPPGGSCTSGFCGPAPVERGTIMSYCHNIFSSAVPQSRFVFGLASEVSHHVLDDYLLRPAGPISGWRNIVSGTATVSAITGPTSVNPSSTGNTQSITVSAHGVSASSSTITWGITGGTITGGQGTSTVTFTAGASGIVALTVTVTNNRACSISDSKNITINAPAFNPPTNVVATATGASTVQVTWIAASGTAPGRYNVYRTANVISAYALVGNTTGTTFDDTTALANTSYMYKVRSADGAGANESVDSNLDLATTVIFTNPTLTAGVSTIQKVDIDELRTAIDKVRALGNTGAASYGADPTITAGATTIIVNHVDEMRTYLNVGRTNAGLPTVSFTHTLTSGSTPIRALDFQELRNGAQ